MSRMIGTVSRGVRAPIIRSGDDLAKIVTESVLEAAKDGGYEIRDRDIVAMTEAIVARAQGNYATVEDIAADSCRFCGGQDYSVVSVEYVEPDREALDIEFVADSYTLAYLTVISFPGIRWREKMQCIEGFGIGRFVDMIYSARNHIIRSSIIKDRQDILCVQMNRFVPPAPVLMFGLSIEQTFHCHHVELLS